MANRKALNPKVLFLWHAILNPLSQALQVLIEEKLKILGLLFVARLR